jgi:hypothetical protein
MRNKQDIYFTRFILCIVYSGLLLFLTKKNCFRRKRIVSDEKELFSAKKNCI